MEIDVDVSALCGKKLCSALLLKASFCSVEEGRRSKTRVDGRQKRAQLYRSSRGENCCRQVDLAVVQWGCRGLGQKELSCKQERIIWTSPFRLVPLPVATITVWAPYGGMAEYGWCR
jgi:hypothetical protein